MESPSRHVPSCLGSLVTNCARASFNLGGMLQSSQVRGHIASHIPSPSVLENPSYNQHPYLSMCCRICCPNGKQSLFSSGVDNFFLRLIIVRMATFESFVGSETLQLSMPSRRASGLTLHPLPYHTISFSSAPVVTQKRCAP